MSTEIDSEKSLAKSAVNGLGWQYTSVFVQAVLQLVVLSLVSRLLKPEDFGLMSLALIFSGLAGLISQMGVGPALIQRAELSDSYITTSFALSLCAGIFMTVVIWVAAPIVAIFFREVQITTILRGVSLSFLFSSAGAVAEALLVRSLQFDVLMWIGLGSYLCYGILGILFAWLGYGVWALVFATLGQSLVKSVANYAASRHSIKLKLKIGELRSILRFGSGVTLGTMFNYAANQADYFVVGRFLGIAPLGIYSRAYQLMRLPVKYIGQGIQNVSFPAMVKLQENRSQLAMVYLSIVAALGFVTFPVSVLMAVCSSEIVYVLLGPQWSEVIIPFQILAAGIFFRTAYKVDHSVTKALGAVYRRSAVDAVYALSVFGAALVGWRWGLAGVATGVLLAIVLNFLLAVRLSLQLLHVSWIEVAKAFSPGLVAAVTAALVAVPLHAVLTSIKIAPLVLLGVTSVGGMVGVTAAFFVFPSLLGIYGVHALRILLRSLPVSLIPQVLRRHFNTITVVF